MQNIKVIVLLICITALLTACKDDFFDQVVDVDIPEHTPALAVTCNLSNQDSILLAYVTSSIGVLEQENPETITDAKVELFKNGELFHTLPYIDQGFYGWEIEGLLGNENDTYELRVEKEDFESVNSIQRMPDQIDIISASFEKDGTIDPEGERVDELVIKFKDQKDVANYYKVEVYFEFTIEDITYRQDYYFDSNDPAVNFTNDGIYLPDIIFDGNTYELRLYAYDLFVDEFWENPALIVNLVHLSSDKYFRETSIRAYENSEDNPFAEPAVIFSNIENGYGIFSLEAVGPEYRIPL